MSLSVADLDTVLHDLFTDQADTLARDCGFCLRKRCLDGPTFAQAVVFQLLRKPDATLEDYADFAADHLDCHVTPKAFDERFTPQAADFLQGLFTAAFHYAFDHLRPNLLPVLHRFPGVYLRDGSLIRLPDALADLFPGRPTPAGQPTAAVKLVLEVEVQTGVFTDVTLLPGRDNEQLADVAAKPLPAGALVLEDMGFFAGERLQAFDKQGVYFLTRVPTPTAFFTQRGQRYQRFDLRKCLRQARGDYVEHAVHMLCETKIAVRLLAVRVPAAVAQQRREAVRQDAAKRGRPVSQRKLELCDWNILVTNAPDTLLSGYEVGAVRRVRWQIELVFKVFKSEGGLERTWARTRARVEAELFGKLLAQVVQQWCLLTAGYVMLRHSARRLSRRVRAVAGAFVEALRERSGLERVVQRLAAKLLQSRIVTRPGQPSTFDRLAEWDYEFRQLDEVA